MFHQEMITHYTKMIGLLVLHMIITVPISSTPTIISIIVKINNIKLYCETLDPKDLAKTVSNVIYLDPFQRITKEISKITDTIKINPKSLGRRNAILPTS